MGPVDYIAIALTVLIVGAAVFYIVRAKKNGQKCIGCPSSKQCAGKCCCENGHSKADQDKGHS